LSDGTIRNAYSLRVRNMEDRPRRFAIAFSGVPGARMWADDMARGEASGGLTRMVDADQTLALRVYVEAPANATGRPLVFTLAARDAEGGSATYTTRFGTPDATTTESP